MSGEKDKELEDRLNKQAKKQYEEYLAADKWTCPQCGRKYHWQKNDEGRYAFCPKCQLASKDKA
jgi:rubrerythrin